MTSTNGSSGTIAQSRPAGLPMFYSRPEALRPSVHGGLGMRQDAAFDFARRAHAIPIMAAEMPAAMRSYPIVFIGPQKMPVVLTGVRREENLFIDAGGRWTVPHYVPAYVRRYPFVLAEDAAGGRLALCVDRESERVQPVGTSDVVAFFDGDMPTDTTRQALAFCEQYQAMHNATRAIMQKIEAFGLLAERRNKITLDSGETINLTDFLVIDEAALNKLDDRSFLQLRAAGALPVIYCQMASMNSWNSLLHEVRGKM